MTRRQGYIVVACVLVALAVGFAWRLAVGPSRMVSAIQRGDLRKITIFARLGIRPDSDAFLVGGFMHCAAAGGQTQVMAKLQDLGASVDRLDGYGVAPLHVAVHSHRIESIRWLLAHGADPLVRDRNGRTAIDCVSSDVPQQQQAEFISTLRQTSNQHLQPTPR